MEENGLRGQADLRAGTTLRLPGGDAADPWSAAPGATSDALPAATLSTQPEVSPPVESRTHRVLRGETLAGLSRAYGVSIEDLRRANGIRGDRIVVGQVLRIP